MTAEEGAIYTHMHTHTTGKKTTNCYCSLGINYGYFVFLISIKWQYYLLCHLIHDRACQAQADVQANKNSK